MVTIRDVSRALNNTVTVRPGIRERVRRASSATRPTKEVAA
ncbi:MAG: hypothetical protein ACLPTM_02435 [Steroidobacteraceae bacterium]